MLAVRAAKKVSRTFKVSIPFPFLSLVSVFFSAYSIFINVGVYIYSTLVSPPLVFFVVVVTYFDYRVR